MISSPGGPEVLRWQEVPDPPPPGPGEVTIDVVASAVNRADLLQRQGLYPPPPGVSEILGMECSGRIGALGPDVDQWKVGDEVCALLAGGGYATRVVAPVGQVLPVPSGVDIVEAAGLPEASCTVHSSVFTAAQVRDGDLVLIHGGASGIGTFAIQLVRAARPASTVAVTAGSEAKLRRCRELGAQVAISYRDDDFVAVVREATAGQGAGQGADVILDIMGAPYLARNVAALAPDGRLVVIGMQGGVKAELNLGELLVKRGTLYGTTLRGRPLAQKAAIVAAVREEVWPHVAAGRVKPVIDRTLPMSEAAEAHRAVADLEHVGKVVLVTGV
jgi:NADPH2:quinone reductase